MCYINSKHLFVALCLLLIANGDNSTIKSRKNWIPLLVSLSLDLYSKWPELTGHFDDKLSPIESEERSRRLLDFLWYPLRTPLYQSVTSNVLDGVEGRIGSIGVLGPVAETIKIYRKLCENVYFYASAS